MGWPGILLLTLGACLAALGLLVLCLWWLDKDPWDDEPRPGVGA